MDRFPLSRGFACAVALLGATGLAPADVIVGTLDPDLSMNVAISDFDPVVIGQGQAANAFTLEAGLNVITDIHWWGGYAGLLTDNLATDDFTVRIFTDNGFGAPRVFPFALNLEPTTVMRVDTGMNIGVTDIYRYSLDIAPLTLLPGVTYYLSIVNDTAGDDDTWVWVHTETLASVDPWWHREADVQFWDAQTNPIPGDPAFALTNDRLIVPEPATLGLFALGAAATLARKRRARR
jgi:hypothetical protein